MFSTIIVEYLAKLRVQKKEGMEIWINGANGVDEDDKGGKKKKISFKLIIIVVNSHFNLVANAIIL